MTKRLLPVLLLLVLAVSAGAVAGCGGDLPGDAVAKVGDTLIMEDVFNTRVQEFATQYSMTSEEEDPEGWAQFESDVLEYLITYEMVIQKAEEYEITVTDEEVQTEVDNIITSYYGGDETAFTEDLVNYGMTLDQLKLNYEESMLMQKVYEKVTETVAEPTEEEILAYYEANKDYYFTDETRATRHILIMPGTSEKNEPSTTTTAPWGSSTTTTIAATDSTTTTTAELTDADWADALAVAEEVRAKLEDGGDWTELAAEYSDDAGTATNGGELGDVAKGEMVEEFENAVFSLAVDDISEPIKTTYGYHVIQVTAITEAKQYTLDDSGIRDDIVSTLTSEAQTEAWNTWLEDTKTELGVIYKTGLEPITTTTAAESTDTTSGGETLTTVSGETTTTAPGEAIEAETTTTAKP